MWESLKICKLYFSKVVKTACVCNSQYLSFAFSSVVLRHQPLCSDHLAQCSQSHACEV